MADQTQQSGQQDLPQIDPPGYFEGESISRRRFLEVAVQGVGGVAVAGIVLPALGFAVAPVFRSAEERWQGVGPLAEVADDTYIARVVTLVDGIGEAGKSTVYLRRGNPELFAAESADDVIALSTRCAHLGCPVRFVEAAGNFICPCHGGIYDFEGKVLGGPPVRPLDRFQTRVTQAGEVEVGPRYSVTSNLDPVRTRDPGQFTGGIWNVLYPPRPSVPPAP